MRHNTRHMTQKQTVEELGAFMDRAEHDWVAANQHLWTEEYARDFNAERRRKAAKEGAALPDGSYPIYNQGDANNAAILAGKGKAPKERVLAHIRKRVKALGLKMPPSAAPAGA